jgi:hypothetical protein
MIAKDVSQKTTVRLNIGSIQKLKSERNLTAVEVKEDRRQVGFEEPAFLSGQHDSKSVKEHVKHCQFTDICM